MSKIYDTTVNDLSKFDYADNATYTLISSRKSGKSFLIKNLIYLLFKRKQIDVVYCFSYTADVDDNYNWLSKEYIFNPKVLDDTIELIFKIQKKDKSKKVCILLDDFDITSQSNSIDMLYTRGRHYNITTILSAQISTKGVSTAIRNNTQYLFVRKLNSKTIKENIFNMLLNTEFDSGNELYDFVKSNNEDYQFILYLNDDRKSSDSIKIVKGNNQKFQFNYSKPKIKSQ